MLWLFAFLPIGAVGESGGAQSTATKVAWYELAERLSGESDERHWQTIAELASMPDLTSQLTEQLAQAGTRPDTRTFLALDVISTLRLSQMLSAVVAYSERDQSGFAFHALNALINSDNRGRISDRYRVRVGEGRTSPAVRIALIDSLARLNCALTPAELGRFLADPSTEVRSTTLSYIRSFLLTHSHAEYAALIDTATREGPEAIREQARFLTNELSPRKNR